MTRKNISDAVTNIKQKYIIEAADYTANQNISSFSWVKWVATAACLCLVLGALFTMPGINPTPPVSGDDPVVTDPIRGDTTEQTTNDDPAVTGPTRGDATGQTTNSETTTPFGDGKKINVYEIASLNFDSNKVQTLQTALVDAGWSNTECMLCNEYGFVLKGESSGSTNEMTTDECVALAQAFLADSGLDSLLSQNKISYEFESSVNDDLIVTYCYFMCEGERTGAYIRFIFEDDKCIGEVQAHIYSSERIDTLELLTFDQALNNAYEVNSDGVLEEVNAADYTIKNEKLVYINGLPYYRFGGYGINSRGYIDGYALAINIDDSAASEQLHEQYADFKIE